MPLKLGPVYARWQALFCRLWGAVTWGTFPPNGESFKGIVCAKYLYKDMKEHVYWSDCLLHHYSRTWQDRQIYWMARERAQRHNDLLVLILDSYDHAKVCLPRFPFGRTPKRPIYEQIRRK